MRVNPPFNHPGRQSGAVLLVAVLLLLLAGVMTVFAMNVGLFEQRSTGNDLRAKAVNEVAEAGLAQGFEYLMRQNPEMLENAGLWQKCTAADVTFPCGAISAAQIDTDGDGTPDTARRATMYRLQATSHTIPGLDDELANYMLELDDASMIDTAANGADVSYGVAPVVCFMARPATSAANQPIQCGAPGASGTTDLKAVTFVSVAKIPGESASATLVQTLGEYPTLNDPMGKPPITASGSAGVTGTLQIVTNPNAGGPGVPVSVWNRLNITKTGTTNTCYADEFFRYTQGSANPVPYQGTIRCDDCRCDANGAPATLSYDNSGNLQAEGIDILDVEGDSRDRGTGTNYNVRSDQYSYPTCEFPPDLFRFVFGVRAWNDTNNDCFGETKLANVVYQNPDSGATGSVGPDEAHLYANADKIIPADPSNPSPLIRASQLGTAALLSSSATAGLIWCQANCDIGSNVQVGTPEAPVILVLDRPGTGAVRIQGVVFGMIFIRETGTTMNPATGSSGTGACPSNCSLQMNAGAAIYGALVLQGQMNVNGTSAVIHDATVLRTIAENEGTTPATLPGAWNDQRSY
jgi:hypothetical protein